jgi:regulation of enolase protein 1 (concanavalin A-like superfamily)
LYQDSDNWVKASIEYHNTEYSRLGAVVTNLGYSDWSTSDVPSTIKSVWLRLHRKGQDFKIEHSYDGEHFHQVRLFHLHKQFDVAQVGVVACSPKPSSFKSTFSNIEFKGPSWASETDTIE